MPVTVTISSRLPQLADEAAARAAIVVAKTASDIEAGAKVRAPVDTGALKSSIHDTPRGPLEHEVVVGMEYGIFQEFGTSRMAAQPFLVPATEAARPGFLAALRSVFR